MQHLLREVLHFYLERGLSKPSVTVSIDPGLVRFRVVTETNRDVVSLDVARGAVTPKNPGQAMIESTYSGFSLKACVIVDEKTDIARVVKNQCQQLTPNDPSVFRRPREALIK